MNRTLQQNVRFHTLIKLRRFDKEDKAELVKACTDGRTTSSSAMSMDEMAKAIEILDDEQTGSVKKMRAKIIHIARDIFDLRPRDAWEQEHYDKLNTFLFGKFKAPLHKLSYLKLIDAVTAMEKWRESDTKKMVKSLLNGI